MAVTLLYTWIGGLKSSVITDLFQILIILPLWLILFYMILQRNGGTGQIIRMAGAESSSLLNPGSIPGIKLGIVLTIGITASNMFHTGFWQRIYICPSLKKTKRAFIIGGLLSILVVLMFGATGTIASITGALDPDSPATAFFFMVKILIPGAMPLILILGVMLVMSSIDTLLNGIMSSMNDLFQTDGTESSRRIRLYLLFTAIPAVLIGARGYSVLYLFLLADLVCSSWVIPLIWGIYKTRVGGIGLIISGAAGCIAGGLYFPKPDNSSWSGLTPDLLASFLLALTVSSLFLFIFHSIAREKTE
jgi:Na+/proline symporter